MNTRYMSDMSLPMAEVGPECYLKDSTIKGETTIFIIISCTGLQHLMMMPLK